jgi:hypothetical protein
MKKVKVCILCKHFFFNPGTEDFSENTPGYGWYVKCCKEHFTETGGQHITEEEYRALLLTAENCVDAVAPEGSNYE